MVVFVCHCCCCCLFQAHPADMGSACAFSMTHPHYITSISKGGHLVVMDVRKLSGSLAQGQVPGPALSARVVKVRNACDCAQGVGLTCDTSCIQRVPLCV